MDFLLVDTGWDAIFERALHQDHSSLAIVCPFIQTRPAQRLLQLGRPNPLRIITRFNLDDFSVGVSSIDALRTLLVNGAQIRGIKYLHAKLYIFGQTTAIMTSANLTAAALSRNHELGMVAEENEISARCNQYFERLWAGAGQDLQATTLDNWQRAVADERARGGCPRFASGLGDYGVDIGLPPTPIVLPGSMVEAEQSFVKFFGESNNRAVRNLAIFDEVRASGSHWACTYPLGRRPRAVQDDAVMFMARLVGNPVDSMIYGRARGLHHQDRYDDATAYDRQLRPWKDKWPHYIRVHHAEFLAGKLGDGVSFHKLMSELGPDSFTSTQRNASERSGNTDPRKACMQKPAMQLTRQSYQWLNDRLDEKFAQYGALAPGTTTQLDWPSPIAGRA